MEPLSKSTRSYRSEEEIKALLQEFELSEVTVKEFCEMYSISEATFYNWRTKYGTKENEERGEFIQLSGDLPGSSSFVFAELELPSKAVVRFFDKVEVAYLKALLSC